MSTYLDFEEPIRALEEQILQTKEIGISTSVDMQDKIIELEKKLKATSKEIFSNLSPWQRVQLSRHPDRPYTLAYIDAITGGNFLELHGDRGVKDDKAMIGGFGAIDGRSVMFIGQQKGVLHKSGLIVSDSNPIRSKERRELQRNRDLGTYLCPFAVINQLR